MTHTPPAFDPDRIHPLTEAQLWALMQGLSEDRVKILKGNSYVQAWDVKATLTRVFGFGGFSTQILSEEVMFAEQADNSKGGKNWSVGYRVSLRLIIPQLGAFFDEAAVGSNAQPSRAEATDNAVKGATSDALKRCATMLGTQFGLSLYDNGNLNEVIKTIVAPGQEWERNAKVDVEARRAARQQRPASAGDSVAHLRPNGVTEEQHAANQDLLNQALSAKRKQQEPDPAGEEYQRNVANVPMALDESLIYNDDEPAMAGDRDQ